MSLKPYTKRRGRERATCDGAMNDGAVLELDRDGLVVQLHQKPKNSLIKIGD